MTTAALPLTALADEETVEERVLSALARLPVGKPFTAQEAAEYAEDRAAIDAPVPVRTNRDVIAAARARSGR
jgi:hypothetical protein